MRKIISSLLVFGMIMLTLPQQMQGQKVGVGINYGQKLSTVGGTLDATYRFHQYFRISGNVSVFWPKDFRQSNNRWNWWTININGNFVFLETGRFRTYLLTGLNYATIQVDYAVTGSKFVDSNLGLNAGGGLEYSFSFGDVFGESKYIFINERYQQTVANIGVRFYLGGE
jgi:hypothetical protein